MYKKLALAGVVGGAAVAAVSAFGAVTAQRDACFFAGVLAPAGEEEERA